MTKTVLTHDAVGGLVVPSSVEEWDEWVSATKTRNHVLGSPLLDWLDRYGESKGYERERPDPRTDFVGFVFKRGREFEARVTDHLRERLPGGVRTIVSPESGVEVVSLAAAEATWEAMTEAVPIIAQGVLRDARHRVYGSPDLLMRSDILGGLFPECVNAEQSAIPALDLDIGDRHYVIVDIKYSTLEFTAGGGRFAAGGSAMAYKTQVFLYNRALGHLQGFLPSRAFLLGRGWRRKRKGVTERSDSCMDRLGPVSMDEVYQQEGLETHVDRAVEWIRRMRRHGQDWEAVPPSVEELRPNPKDKTSRWASAVNRILAESEDLTQLWNVGVARRRRANRAGLVRWTDPRVTPEALGMSGSTAGTLRALLDVNRQPDGPPLLFAQQADRPEWIQAPPLEFYVDFETVSNLNDDFARFPEKNGQPLIFMIGCGHIEEDQWQYECFVADQLVEPDEADIIEAWLEHMQDVRGRVAPDTRPRVIHWSAAEVSTLETAYNAARRRHPEREQQWEGPNWFDFLSRVMRTEPVAVRGSHGFGLKTVTNALHDHGLIDCEWDTATTDGLGAMVGAWWCQEQINQGQAHRLIDIDLMKQIKGYNQTDCRAMMEIISHLRTAQPTGI